MESEIIKKLDEILALTALGAKSVLTTQDASLYTGLSRSHLYKCVCYKKIPHYKSEGGKFTYFDRGELEQWMKHRRVKTDAELETEAANIVVNSKKRR